MVIAHTDREYERELGLLREKLLMMGAKVEEMIALAMRAFGERDSLRARQVISLDDEVDDLELVTDDLCLRILAKRQPVASDLRTITIAMKMVTDLERIGDLAVNIAERVTELNDEPSLPMSQEVLAIGEYVRSMLRDALDAFVTKNVEQATRVISRDREVDALYAQALRVLLDKMRADPALISRAIRVQSVAKHLERVGDHATNLAERTIFLLQGVDVRHGQWSVTRPRGVLFLCVANAARSQMAEGLARSFRPRSLRAFSAGSQPGAAVHPLAIRVMDEIGIDLRQHRPKSIADIPMGEVDTVVTLCAEEQCPKLPSSIANRHSWELPDPATATGTEEEKLARFRTTRDELAKRLRQLIA